jgi:ADP-heptose:LPS heptosyltransferase
MRSKSAQQIVITHGCAPGDITCLTGLVRDISLAYPDKYEIHVATHCKTLWNHNPYIAGNHGHTPHGMQQVHLNYGKYIPEANRHKLHFVTAFHRDFQKRSGQPVPCLHPKGDLHLDDWHYKNPPMSGRYWILVPGNKSDFTTKAWSAHRWQQLADGMSAAGLHMVRCGATHQGNVNPPVDGAIDLVDKTNLRDLLWLIYHAEGVVCPVTCFMHMAAAFDKPCVVLAGGREHWWWEAYVNVAGVENFGPYSQSVKVPHRYLHTQGLLDCCKDRGCWKNKILHTQKDKHRSYCKRPVDDGYGQKIPECLKMVTVEHVLEAVMSYYTDGTLPPIGKPKELVIPKAEEPPKRVLVPNSVDLFAPAAQIISKKAAKTVTIPPKSDVPALLHAFQGERKTKQGRGKKSVDNVLDHTIIGGKMTICALMYGDYPDMHRACLGSILKTTSPARRDIRIATNQVCMKTRKWLEELKDEGQLHTLILNDDNRKKYPAMRQLFWDKDNPIDTKWIVWFDDDSIANRDADWYPHLASKIINEYVKNARMVGDLRFWTMNPAQLAWPQKRPWWRGRPLQTKQKAEAPNAQNVFFAAGGFWALETKAMREAMIPDPDIGHNGGDYTVGLQLWQQGYRTAAWNHRKSHVNTSSVGRRGLNELHTGMPGWKPGGVSKGRRVAV